ncbi:MAG: HEAT repeat domain-containing protein [Planctomycetota bacterium]
MDIHFCDLCNESIPASDLARGAAVRRNERIVCRHCEAAMSAAGTPEQAARVAASARARAGGANPPAAQEHARAVTDDRAQAPLRAVERGRSRAALWVASLAFGLGLLAVGGVLVGGLVLRDRIEADRRARGQEDARMARVAELESARVEGRLAQRLGALEGAQTDLRAAESELRSRADDQAARANETLDELRAAVAGLAARLDRLDALPEQVARFGGELGTVAAAQPDLFAEFRGLRERVAELERGAPAVAAGNAGADPPTAPQNLGWQSVLSDLESPNAGTRWEAVQRLGDTRDAAVVPHLSAHMDDDDLFVRMAVARILGDLGSLAGVPALIDGLEDPEPSVREAAVVSLRSLTGRDFRFDPIGRSADRAKRVKAWRIWWEKEGVALSAAE